MILNLQYLRGIAALMVVLFHATDGSGRLGEGAELPRFAQGFAGVDLFFVLSGFIIWTTTRGAGAGRPGAFVRKRLVRVVPLYWLLTLLLANVAILRPDLLGSTVFRPAHFFASMAFLPALHPTFDLYNPLLVVGWTLNYEMAFYALFALVLLLPEKRQAGAAVAMLACLALAGRVLAPGGVAGFYTDPIVLEFAAGLVVGWLYTGGMRISAATCAAMGAAGIALLIAFADEAQGRVLTAGVPETLIVAAAVFGERARGPLRLPGLQALGDASYSLYLTHLMVLPVAQIVWRKLGIGAAGWAGGAFVPFAVLACIAAGLLCHRLVERPLADLLRPARVPPRAFASAG